MGCQLCERTERRTHPDGTSNNPVTTKEFICSVCVATGNQPKRSGDGSKPKASSTIKKEVRKSKRAPKKKWTPEERDALKSLVKKKGAKEAVKLFAERSGRSEHSVGYQVYQMTHK